MSYKDIDLHTWLTYKYNINAENKKKYLKCHKILLWKQKQLHLISYWALKFAICFQIWFVYINFATFKIWFSKIYFSSKLIFIVLKFQQEIINKTKIANNFCMICDLHNKQVWLLLVMFINLKNKIIKSYSLWMQ
jgi:hypothetical protein